MGDWYEYCQVCGGPPYAPSDDIINEEDLPLTTPLPDWSLTDDSWLESFNGISVKEELIPLAYYNQYGAFVIDPDTTAFTGFSVCSSGEDYDLGENVGRGHACHVACYNLLQHELNYTLKYADVEPLLVDDDSNEFSWSDYGGLARYHQQFFPYMPLVEDGKLWMLEDPGCNGENKERILRVWRPLVESGFKRPEASVGDDGTSVPEIAETNVDDLRA